MKAIIKYQCDDGTVHDTDSSAKAHEDLLVNIGKAMMPLGPEVEHSIQQKGWIQHSEANYEKAKKDVLLLVIPSMGDTFKDLAATCRDTPEKVHPMSYVGRFISECCDTALNKAWWRLCCIDDKFREHNQPYFALNGPAEGHICIADRS